MGRKGLFSCVAALICVLLTGTARAAEELGKGTATGLPLPRFASLKSDRVNLREGPSKDHRTTWIFQRAGLPVEITAEFEIWRRIRDSEGTEGWVLHSLLSGRRTALVSPWARNDAQPIFAKAAEESGLAAQLQSGVLATIKRCDGTWCRLSGEGYDGWIRQDRLWGAYPDEKID